MSSLAQRRALAIMPKISGALSMLGSGFIIMDVTRDHRKRGHSYSRLVLGASCFDLVSSFMYFLSTWPIPSAASGIVYGGSGTTASCTFQGFFIQLGLGLPLYNLSLSVYYYLIICLQWSNGRIERVERWMHVGSILIAIATAAAGVPLTLYNNAVLWCWISSLPASCANTRNGTGQCIRGDNAWIYRWAFVYGPLWFIILLVSIIMGTILFQVWVKEAKSRKYRYTTSTNNNKNDQQKQQTATTSSDSLNSLTHQLAKQALFYLLAFLLSAIFPTILRLFETMERTVPYAIALLVTIFLPLQGFWNAVIYVRPRYIRFRQMNPNVSILQTTWNTLSMTIGKNPFRKEQEEDQLAKYNWDDSEEGKYSRKVDTEVLDPGYALQKGRSKVDVGLDTEMDSEHDDESGSSTESISLRGVFAQRMFASLSSMSTTRSSRRSSERGSSNAINEAAYQGKNILGDLPSVLESGADPCPSKENTSREMGNCQDLERMIMDDLQYGLDDDSTEGSKRSIDQQTEMQNDYEVTPKSLDDQASPQSDASEEDSSNIEVVIRRSTKKTLARKPSEGMMKLQTSLQPQPRSSTQVQTLTPVISKKYSSSVRQPSEGMLQQKCLQVPL